MKAGGLQVVQVCGAMSCVACDVLAVKGSTGGSVWGGKGEVAGWSESGMPVL